MTTAPERVRIKCYLEGIEIPIGSIQFSWSIGSGVRAMIGIPPVPSALELTPKTIVHLTWVDPYDEAQKELCIYEGEYLGYEYIKEATTRRFVLHAMDLTNNLDALRLVMMDKESDVSTVFSHLIGGLEKNNADILIFENPVMSGQQSSLSYVEREMITAPKSDPIGGFIRKLMDRGISLNKFYQQRNKKIQFDKKWMAKYVDPKRMSKFITSRQLAKSIDQRIHKTAGSFTSVRNIIGALASVLKYQLISIPSATYKNNRLNSMILYNENYYYPPPTCNVIYASRSSQVNFSRSFGMEPTRLISKNKDMLFVAPREFYDKMKDTMEYLAEKDRSPLVTSAASASDPIGLVKKQKEREEYASNSPWEGEPMVSEEFTGPVLGEGTNVPLSTLMMYPRTGEKNIGALGQHYLQYDFFRQKYGSRTCNIVMDFNPYIAVGFPAAYIDKTGVYTLGYIEGASHIVDSNGILSTQVAMRYARQYSRSSTLGDWRSQEPGPPVWFGEEDLNVQDINRFYWESLGCGSILEPTGEEVAESRDRNIFSISGEEGILKNIEPPKTDNEAKLEELKKELSNLPYKYSGFGKAGKWAEEKEALEAKIESVENDIKEEENKKKEELKKTQEALEEAKFSFNPYEDNPLSERMKKSIDTLYDNFKESLKGGPGDASNFACKKRTREIARIDQVWKATHVGSSFNAKSPSPMFTESWAEEANFKTLTAVQKVRDEINQSSIFVG